jgi:hypothetical protein
MSLFSLIRMGGRLGIRCAWCNVVMREPKVSRLSAGRSDPRLDWSHGICVPCRAQIEDVADEVAEPLSAAAR